MAEVPEGAARVYMTSEQERMAKAITLLKEYLEEFPEHDRADFRVYQAYIALTSNPPYDKKKR